MSTIKIPNLGDGITSATILSILVKVGDTIAKNQTIIELETDKATAPVPATEAGVVSQILVKEGDTVNTGTPVIAIGGEGQTTPTPTPATATSTPPTQVIAIQPQSPSATPVTISPLSGAEPASTPAARRLAQELGLDLRLLGSSTRVTPTDIKNFIQGLIATASQGAPAAAQQAKTTLKSILPDFSKFGEITEQKLSTLRKKIAEKMTESWTQVPHVTQFEEVDITGLMALRKKYNPKFKEKGANLTVTIMVVKALVDTLKAFPNFNSSFDSEAQTLILKNYYNIGVAVDTDSGLIVPIIKNADQKTLLELCLDVQALAEKARDRKLGIDDLQGGSMTISNLGSLGVGAFTPIINTPEVAILGLSAGKLKPMIIEDKIETRLMMPLSLSYDHRVIDGADGARFIKHFIQQLEQLDESLFKLKK